MPRTRFSVNPHSIVDWMSKNSLLETGAYLKFKWQQRDSSPKHLFRKRTLWLNNWVFVYELSGCGFESRCFHLIYYRNFLSVYFICWLNIIFFFYKPITCIRKIWLSLKRGFGGLHGFGRFDIHSFLI